MSQWWLVTAENKIPRSGLARKILRLVWKSAAAQGPTEIDTILAKMTASKF
jgi:hypothetical protein